MIGLHHVQVACPPGGEDGARRFYARGLGLSEVDKPADLAGRGGCWFRDHGRDGEVRAEIHVGVESPFVPARKAHPALLFDSVAALEEVGVRVERLGFTPDWSQRHTFPGYQRLHVFDAVGNRVELMAAAEVTA